MNVLICKSLFQSLASLSGAEVKRANDFILKFQDNPAQPGLSLERITKTQNDNLWSAGSEFSIDNHTPDLKLAELIKTLRTQIKQLAKANHITIPNQPPQPTAGHIISIWQAQPTQWREIVHGVCSTQNSKKPDWCGSSEQRPSGYAIRQHTDHCLATVFDPAVEATLKTHSFQRIWPA